MVDLFFPEALNPRISYMDLSQFKRVLGRAKFLTGWIFQAGYNNGESWNWGKAAAK
jgi:hypothetical protein